jgi:hypothetical protein
MLPRPILVLVLFAAVLAVGLGAGLSRRDLPKLAERHRAIVFARDVQPLLERYCYACHGEKKKGGLDFRVYRDEKTAAPDRVVFEKMLKNLEAHEMPPESKPQPTSAERELITTWVSSFFFPCDCNHPDPGRVTIRRLNRAEYNNTVRDLVGVNFQPAEDFPADDSGYGFDNIGDVLSLSPILLEKYLTAAEKILEAAIVTGPRIGGPKKKFDADKLESTAPGEPYGNGARILTREGEITTEIQMPKAGEYVLRARAFGQQAGPDPARMEFRLDGKPIRVFDVKAVEAMPQVYEYRTNFEAGHLRFSAAYINNYVNQKDPDPDNRDRNLIIDYLELLGPIEEQPLPETHRRIFIAEPTSASTNDSARTIISNFARKAFRRPVSDSEIDRLMVLFKSAVQAGDDFPNAIRTSLEAVLISPHFLFRGELQPEPNNPKLMRPVDEYALASRLSYFLWSSMPDDQLFDFANRGILRRNLDAQIKRMLKDPKSSAFVENFAGQWLQLRNLKLVAPDTKQFPIFDDSLRAAMQKETEMFFDSILRENRSVLDFINADYTFVNEKLGKLYGLNDVKGDKFRKVTLKDPERGGLLSQASILTLTSNPTRTSPVKRGKWVLENILGAPPPPPPPNVPELNESKEAVLTGTLRQRMEQHRANPGCASCHARMDPIGFGLENFDAIGGWREKDSGLPIDASGTLVTGESFTGPAGLRAILLKQKREEFIHCISEKVLTYALGRGLEYYDKCAEDQIAKNLAKDHYRFSSLIAEVVKSAPFQMRRGEGDITSLTAAESQK